MGERYEIVKKIGQGGVGEVFVAQDTQLGREVALKRIKPSQVRSDGADDLFAEAKTLSALQHPNIVTIYDIGQDEEGAFAVMELLKGETLDRTVDRGALTLEDFRNVVRQTLEGLMAAQTVGVLHRDLKPANLMVIWLPSGKFQLKILDFGLAKFSKQPSEQTSDQGDGIMGSIYFMAPEQFERGALDPRTDMYSLGCVYYYALTQRHPFEGGTPAQVMASHLRHDVVDLKQLRPDLPAELCTWVMWFINRKPDDRPEDAKQAYEYFKEQNAGEAPPVPAEPPPVAGAKRPTLVVGAGAGAGAARASVMATPAIAPTTVLTEDPTTIAAARMPGRPGMPVAPQRKGGGGVFPKWALVTLPLLLVAGGVIAMLAINQTSDQQEGYEAVKRMMEEAAPEGDAGTVGMLVEMLEEENVMVGAATVLAKLKGPGVVQEMVRRLPDVKNPKGKINLISAIGMQEYEGAGPALVTEVVTATNTDVRKQALGVLMGVASERDLPALIKLLPKIKGQQEQAALQEAILKVCLDRKTDELRSAPLLAELPKAKDTNLKGQIMYMLGRVGGKRSLEAIQMEIAGGDKDTQDAGIRALAEWPTTEPAEVLFQLAENGADIYRKAVALLAYNQVVSYGGDKPMDVRAQMLRRSFEFARANEVPKVEEDVFRKLSALFAPEALALAKEFEGDEKVGRFAKSSLPAIERGLDRLMEIAEGGGKVVASRGETMGDGVEYQSRENGGVIGEWESEQATVVWLVRFLKAGTYDVKLDGAATATMGGTVWVQLAGMKLEGPVAKTGGEEVFTSAKLGEVVISEPGAYQLTVGAKKIEGEYLMLLRSVELEAK